MDHVGECFPVGVETVFGDGVGRVVEGAKRRADGVGGVLDDVEIIGISVLLSGNVLYAGEANAPVVPGVLLAFDFDVAGFCGFALRFPEDSALRTHPCGRNILGRLATRRCNF